MAFSHKEYQLHQGALYHKYEEAATYLLYKKVVILGRCLTATVGVVQQNDELAFQELIGEQ